MLSVYSGASARGAPRPLVVGLLPWSRPSTIARFVVPVIVDAIERFAGWAFPHVSEKSGEAFHPIRVHFNTAAAIVRKFRVVGISASILRARVAPESSGFLSASLLPMRKTMRKFALNAPATCRVAISQVAKAGLRLLSTVAFAYPHRDRGNGVKPLHCHQSAKPLTGQIKSFHTESSANQRGIIAQKRGFENIARIIKR